MTPAERKKLGAMGYFDNKHNPQEKLNEQIRTEKGDKFVDARGKYSDDIGEKTTQYAGDLVQGSGLNPQGIKYLKNVMENEAENIELYLENEDWTFIREKHGMAGVKREMDRIKKETTDNALFHLEKEFGYDDPKPRNTGQVGESLNGFDGLFSQFKDEELKDYKNRDIDYAKAKQIAKDSIEKSMSRAEKDLPVEE
jgi:hypothetical protein